MLHNDISWSHINPRQSDTKNGSRAKGEVLGYQHPSVTAYSDLHRACYYQAQ
jgi:hypothetical protein